MKSEERNSQYDGEIIDSKYYVDYTAGGLEINIPGFSVCNAKIRIVGSTPDGLEGCSVEVDVTASPATINSSTVQNTSGGWSGSINISVDYSGIDIEITPNPGSETSFMVDHRHERFYYAGP